MIVVARQSFQIPLNDLSSQLCCGICGLHIRLGKLKYLRNISFWNRVSLLCDYETIWSPASSAFWLVGGSISQICSRLRMCELYRSKVSFSSTDLTFSFVTISSETKPKEWWCTSLLRTSELTVPVVFTCTQNFWKWTYQQLWEWMEVKPSLKCWVDSSCWCIGVLLIHFSSFPVMCKLAWLLSPCSVHFCSRLVAQPRCFEQERLSRMSLMLSMHELPFSLHRVCDLKINFSFPTQMVVPGWSNCIGVLNTFRNWV